MKMCMVKTSFLPTNYMIASVRPRGNVLGGGIRWGCKQKNNYYVILTLLLRGKSLELGSLTMDMHLHLPYRSLRMHAQESPCSEY